MIGINQPVKVKIFMNYCLPDSQFFMHILNSSQNFSYSTKCVWLFPCSLLSISHKFFLRDNSQ
jgi:hypothetical protein